MLKDTSVIAIEAANIAQHKGLIAPIAPSEAIVGIAKELLDYTHVVDAGINILLTLHNQAVAHYYERLARLYGTYINSPSAVNLDKWLKWEKGGSNFYDRNMTDPVNTLYLAQGEELRSYFSVIRKSPIVRGDKKSLDLLNALEARVLTAYYVTLMPRLWYVREGVAKIVNHSNYMLLRGAAQLVREGKFDFEVFREFEQRVLKTQNGTPRCLIIGVSEAIVSAFFFDRQQIVTGDFSSTIQKRTDYHELLDTLLQWLAKFKTPIPTLWSTSYYPMKFEYDSKHVRTFLAAVDSALPAAA